MSELLHKCVQCHRQLTKEDEYPVVSSEQFKCRNCILLSKSDGCSADSALENTTVTFPKEQSRNKSKISLQTHIVEEISSDGTTTQYCCTVCGKNFKSRSQKYYHLQCIQSQDVTAQYECDVCKKTFARLSQLKYHKESHASPVNECSKCQKTFSNPIALRKHQSLHKIEPKQCPHCHKTFLKKISLEQHIAGQHLKQLQYGCAVCNKSYASKSTLQLHLQSHEKKRFECSYCGKFFQRNSILNLHLKRHNPVETHICEICNKVFREPGALSRHSKIHEENSLHYYCTLCDKTILRKDNMNRHINTIHPDEHFNDVVTIIKPSSGQNKKESKNVKENKKNSHLETKPLEKLSNNIQIIEHKVLQNPKENVISNIKNYHPGLENNNKCVSLTNIELPITDTKIETKDDENNVVNNDALSDESKYLSIDENIPLETKYLNSNNEIPKKLSYKKIIPNSNANETEHIFGHNKASVIRSIGNVKKMLNLTPCPPSQAKPLDCEYKHKKYNRHYNVDLYRKILGCDDDYEDANLEEEKQQQNICDVTNASTPVHWRKSFKNSYETSAL